MDPLHTTGPWETLKAERGERGSAAAGCLLTSLQHRLVKSGGRLMEHARDCRLVSRTLGGRGGNEPTIKRQKKPRLHLVLPEVFVAEGFEPTPQLFAGGLVIDGIADFGRFQYLVLDIDRAIQA